MTLEKDEDDALTDWHVRNKVTIQERLLPRPSRPMHTPHSPDPKMLRLLLRIKLTK